MRLTGMEAWKFVLDVLSLFVRLEGRMISGSSHLGAEAGCPVPRATAMILRLPDPSWVPLSTQNLLYSSCSCKAMPALSFCAIRKVLKPGCKLDSLPSLRVSPIYHSAYCLTTDWLCFTPVSGSLLLGFSLLRAGQAEAASCILHDFVSPSRVS